ncbi:cytochrome c oxidase subunit 4 isoform 1, mitochondrial [Neodiprion pinetum]|uniref:Cytochrome c oxidase subunit 4 n=1 Tax=Neodiprion lecontei TaxID=441921 RepID=A0A6J0CCW0_NEOLC|nr:cytochrome c oxidase subunit 4 isoform 1, mitochondrial [Neodiprion lecontei]XP_046470932.1 cytochrome c oxidase subunit 4 isoform 1, mitochondrial [Neodiprion pinetum]
MAGKVLATRLLQCSRVQNTAGMSTYANKIGNREVVCYGMNGDPTYIDRVDFPMPAIRYKEPTADIQALREKEKGDWKKLSIDEKKALYRASFCQTFAEINAPTGEWKSIIGWALFGSSLSLWIFMAMKKYVYPPLPVTFDEEHQLAQLDRIIKLDMNPIDGINARK